MHKNTYKMLSVSLLIVFFIVSCQVENISQTQLKLARFSLQRADLPDGWRYSGENWYQDLGGESYTVAYEVSEIPKIGFGHTVSAYETNDKAIEAYPKWEEDVFSDAWKPWPEADFMPSSLDDLYRFECFQLSLNSPIDCDYLQLHNQFISHVSVNLDSKSMTFEQLNEILGTLDKRLNEVLIENDD